MGDVGGSVDTEYLRDEGIELVTDHAERRGDTPLRNVRIDDELWTQAKAATRANRTTPSDVMRRALIRYVKTHPLDGSLDGLPEDVTRHAKTLDNIPEEAQTH